MTKVQLQTDISAMDKQLGNPELPAGVRKALQTARDKAQEALDKGKYDKEGPATKKATKLTPKQTNKGNLDDCEEILNRYKVKVEKNKRRAAKREKQGKPKELSVSETVGKAARAVGKKVKKKENAGKSVTKTEAGATVQPVLSLVKKLVGGMDSEADQRGFIKTLIDHLTEEYRHLHVKAETGMYTGEPGKTGQLHIYHYHTQHFNVSAGARRYFEYILAQDPSGERSKSLIIAMARDVDDMLGIARTAQLLDEVTEEQFIYAAGKLMRAMYWSYGIVQAIEGNRADPHKWYPGFLAQDLYVVANKTKRADRPLIIAEEGHRLYLSKEREKVKSDLAAAEISIKKAGGQTVVKNNGSVSFDINGRLYEIARKDNGYELLALSYFDDYWAKPLAKAEKPADLVEKAAGSKKEEGGKVAADTHPGLNLGGMDDPQVNSLSTPQLDGVNDSLSNNENAPDQEIIMHLIEEYGIDAQQAGYLVGTYRPLFQTDPLFQLEKAYSEDRKEAGRRMELDKLSPSAQTTYDECMNRFNKAKNAAEKCKIRQEYLIQPVAVDKVGLPEYEGVTKFLDDTRDYAERGRKVKFSDKVTAVANELKGKEIPKKYQTKGGAKHYTKKTATKAAKNIIGAQVAGRDKPRSRKMLLGGIALSTPPAISLMGDQDNLSIHGAG